MSTGFRLGQSEELLQLVSFGEEALDLGTFGSESSRSVQVPVVAVHIRTQTGTVLDLTVNIVPTISAPVRKEQVDIQKFQFIRGLTLVEPLNAHAEDIKLDMLIGSNYYNDVIGDPGIKLDDGLYLTCSVLG